MTLRRAPCAADEPLEPEWESGHWCPTCALPSLFIRVYSTTRAGALVGVTTVSWCDSCHVHNGAWRP